MKVSIKDFGVAMDVKQRGIEFQVKEPNGDLRGDFYLTMKHVIWCEGQTQRQNGKHLTWSKFIDLMDAYGHELGRRPRRRP
ncbi:MAG: hypothetical protein IIA91_03580 [Chloroflexi bacterium]|nr:hypothetical protein [Chloroflexota bacterium]